jgi:hypothetical protein
MRRRSHIIANGPSRTIDFLIPPGKNSLRPFHTAPLRKTKGKRNYRFRARRRRQTPSTKTSGGGRGRSANGTRSVTAFRSDGWGLAFVPSDNRRRAGSKAVGKPDRAPLVDRVRKHFWVPGTILRALQSRLQTELPQIDRPSIAKPQPNKLFRSKAKWCISKNLSRPGRHCNFNGTSPRPRPVFPCQSTAFLGTVTLNAKVSTIVARFGPGVVNFLFHGRNSGQQKRKEREGAEPGVGQPGRIWDEPALARSCPTTFSCLRGAQRPAVLLRPLEYMFDRRTESCPQNRLWS